MVAAYEVATGRELWTNTWRSTFSEHYGGDGPRATPAWHDGTVFALGAAGELRALDRETGRVRWRTNILQDAGASNLEWGMAASPLVVGATVIVSGRADPMDVRWWRIGAIPASEPGRLSTTAPTYSSPMLVTLAGVEQILVLTASRLVGLSARW